MAEKKKNKSGAGKFFLGAILGAAAGAIAGRFVKKNQEECECGGECKCNIGDEPVAEKVPAAEKKVAEKKTTEKK